MQTKIWRPPLTAHLEHRGEAVELIPLESRHKELLVEGFGLLSERSRYLRFMSRVSVLSGSELEYLTNLDMVDRFAWAALVEGEPAALVRYARTTTRPDVAEVAVTVIDEFQGRGLAPLLIICLAPVAQAVGFSSFEFEVLPENEAMLRVLDKIGAPYAREGDIVRGEIALEDMPPPPVAPDLLLDVVGSARAARET
jgi:RimJ/RimL family protein N-acetyltransferase